MQLFCGNTYVKLLNTFPYRKDTFVITAGCHKLPWLNNYNHIVL